MKKITTLITMLLIAALTITAQPPQAFKYKAIARNKYGMLIINQTVAIRISLLQGSETGIPVYVETHKPTSNLFGVIELEIGRGTPVSGAFSYIDWGTSEYYIKIEMDPKNKPIKEYTVIGTSQLLSVPYALYAGHVQNSQDNDADPLNELITNAYLSGTMLCIQEGGTTTLIDLSGLQDGTEDADADPENEIQDLQLVDNMLTITKNGTATKIDLSIYLDDTDTQLTEAEVDAMVENNGYLTGVIWANIPDVPTDIADGDDNTQLSETEVDAMVENNGYLKDVAWADIPDVPTDLADGDDNTQLSETEVDAMVENNGYLKGVAWADIPDVPADLADGDDNTQLSENEVDAMVANNGYLTAEADGDPTNEIQDISINGHMLSLSGGSTVQLPDEVNDADSDPTNELISGFILNGNSVELSDAGGTRTIDLGSLEEDFSDGGDAAGTDRTLGNTSDHALSLITNNANRLHIKNTGEIGIGTTIPSEMLEVAGTIYSTTGGFKFPDGTVQVTASASGGGASSIDDLSDGKTSDYSVYLGANAGANDDRSESLYNTAIGMDALRAITIGTWNTAMGYGALMSNTEGDYNVGIGCQALENNTIGNSNVCIGREANLYNGGGSQNTIVGDKAGRGQSMHNKGGNVFLGYNAGYFETGSNLLYIENSSSSSPLIWGDFSQNKIKINGSMEVASGIKTSQIQIPNGAQNGYVLTSDASGLGSWKSLSSSPWTVSGSDIYRFSGNVGIGTNQPIFRLDVNGNIRVNGSVRADKLLFPATEQYYSIAGCTFNPTSNNSYVYSRDINCIIINPNEAAGDADLVAPVHIPSGATLENISALVNDNGPASITVSLYLVSYSGGKFNLGSTNSSINSSAPQNLTGSLNSTVDNNNNALVVVVRCHGTYSLSQYYRIYKVTIRYSISSLP